MAAWQETLDRLSEVVCELDGLSRAAAGDEGSGERQLVELALAEVRLDTLASELVGVVRRVEETRGLIAWRLLEAH